MVSKQRVPLSLYCAVALLTAACAETGDVPPGEEMLSESTPPVAPVVADSGGVSVGSDSYVVGTIEGGPGVMIDHRFTNATGATVYLANCNGAFSVTLESEAGGEWTGVYSPPIPACLSPPLEIGPGASHEGTLIVPVGPSQPGVGVQPGRHRLVWGGLHTSWNLTGPMGELIPAAQRTSEPFEITRAPA